MKNEEFKTFKHIMMEKAMESGVDTGHFRHRYTDFGRTNLGVPKFEQTKIRTSVNLTKMCILTKLKEHKIESKHMRSQTKLHTPKFKH